MDKIKTGLAITAILFFTVQAAFPQTNALENWNVKQTDNATVYTPNDLKTGEHYNITLFPNSYPNSIMHQQWFKQFMEKDESDLGTITIRGKIKQGENGLLSGLAK